MTDIVMIAMLAASAAALFGLVWLCDAVRS
jgi:hypothetical protein